MHLKQILNHYREQGFKIALDDVGEGYSSLNMIIDIKPDIIKVDRNIIDGIDTNELKQSVYKALKSICIDNNIQILAEGVETQEELSMVKKLGVDFAQGYYFAKPYSEPIRRIFFLIYLHQLFEDITVFKNKKVVLIEEPLYGKYSFDSDNRKKLPKDIFIPAALSYENDYINEAKEYCKKFDNFGNYQDAITKDTNLIYLFHSNISSSLNVGLLNLNYVIEKIKNAHAPYNAKEGFIRQIIGWRDFMLKIYEDDGVRLRNSNFFEFKNSMPKAIIEGKSGIDILDDVIKKVDKTAYAHHIERLMILGNIFLLLEIKPDDVYEYFMQNYIDAYDWVMVGNVYGMSGFSDGGSITTKPYIASSNYLIKMSDYSKKDSWCKIVDALYWRFLYKYSYLFKDNPRMKMQISLLNKMSEEKLQNHLKTAEEYLKTIFYE